MSFTATQAGTYCRYWTMFPAWLYTYSVTLSGIDYDTICASLGSMNNPRDSVLSICAKRREGGWDAESKRTVGGGIKRKGGAEMLGGEEKMRWWQTQEESETVLNIKAVFIILCIYIYMKENSRRPNLIKEVTLSRWQHTDTHTHRRAEGHGASAAKRWSPLTLWHCGWRWCQPDSSTQGK